MLINGKKNNVTVVGKNKPYCTETASFAEKGSVTDMLKVKCRAFFHCILEYDPEGP